MRYARLIVFCVLLSLIVVAPDTLVPQPPVYATPTDAEWPMFRHDLNHTGSSTSTPANFNYLRWTYTAGSKVAFSSPAVVDGRVYVGSNDHKVHCLNASTGAHLWNYTTGDTVYSSPAVVDGRVYVGSYDDKVYCVDAYTGAHIWDYPTGDYVYSSPAVVNGSVYIGSSDNKVYCLNASTGAHLWNYPTGGDVFSSPAVVDGRVYVGSWDRSIYCLDAETGATIWSYATGWAVESSPAVVDGIVYVGSWDQKVYAIGVVTSQYPVTIGPGTYRVTTISNSIITDVFLNGPQKTIGVNVTGATGTPAFCNVTFPTALLGGPYVYQLNGTLTTPEVITNATHTTIAFTYPHSTHALEIIGTTVIPEDPSLLATMLLLLVLAATLLHTLGRVRRSYRIDPSTFLRSRIPGNDTH
jgi:hypothetical protein